MTHLTANHAATALGQPSSLGRIGVKHGGRGRPACTDAVEAESVFYSPVANFLEFPVAGFHYSVIGGHARIAMAPRLADSHLLIAEIAASESRADGAGAEAQAGDSDASIQIGPVAASDRRKKQ